jgi:hypothetical protein
MYLYMQTMAWLEDELPTMDFIREGISLPFGKALLRKRLPWLFRAGHLGQQPEMAQPQFLSNHALAGGQPPALGSRRAEQRNRAFL